MAFVFHLIRFHLFTQLVIQSICAGVEYSVLEDQFVFIYWAWATLEGGQLAKVREKCIVFCIFLFMYAMRERKKRHSVNSLRLHHLIC